MRNHLLIGAAVAALIMPAAAYAQETTSSIRGSVSANGAPVGDAKIVITDVNTGTKLETSSDSSGTFSATGLRAGGPYQVEVASASGSTTVTDIYTVVGQPYDVPIDLTPATAGTTGDIVITASSIKGAGLSATGPQTVLTATQIARVASVNRDIRDLARRDPFARFEDTSGSGGGKAISFAGVNPRYNKFSIDGVTVSDNFGLNSDASPTRRGPVPLDAIGQFATSVAPYDVRQGGFQGGAMDAVLKTGTNKFSGTAFYSFNSDDLTGDPRRLGGTKFDFKSKTYGATLSGPIIKDKLFFMVSAERNTEGNPLSPAPGQVPNLTAQNIADVTNAAKIAFPSYDVGAPLVSSTDKDEKIVGKLSWNISDRQKLSISFINAYDETNFLQNSSTSSSSPSLGLSSDAYKATELLRAGIAQLNSDWTDNFSTEARFLYKSYVRGQISNGGNFAQVRTCVTPVSDSTTAGGGFTGCGTGRPVVTFGPDSSRQSNVFNTDTYSGSLALRYRAGNHDFKLFAQYDQVKIFNLFLQNTKGNYYYDSVADLRANTASSVTYQNAASGNVNDAAASFGYQQYQFGLQDDWRVSDKLTITAGVRYDLYGSHSPVPLNPGFTARYGFPNTYTYKGQGLLQPRVSFNYKPLTDVSLRGGFGIFGGGSPDVYLSNSYSNAGAGAGGVGITSITVQRVPVTAANPTGYTLNGANIPAATALAVLNAVPGSSIPAALQALIPNTGPNSTANINALTRRFRIPSVYKGTLSVDWTPRDLLGGGWDFGADFYWSRTKDQVYFTDIRSVPVGVLPDGRTRYGVIAGVNNSTNTDIVLDRTGKGRSYVGVVRMSKTFDWGLSLDLAYTRQDVKDQTPATSSTAGSNYGNGAFYDGRGAAYGISNDQVKWSFKYGVGFNHAFFGDYKTSIQLFGSTNAGRPYSITMQDAGTASRSAVFGVTGRDDRFLLYVPTGVNDPLVTYGDLTAGGTSATYDALNNIITANGLQKYRGKILPRNIVRSRAYTQLDIHLAQEIPTFVGDSRVTIFADIQNLPNLLNKKWGGFRQAAFPYVEDVISASCVTVGTNTCGKYLYSLPVAPNTNVAEIKPSLYFIRVGARFSF